MPVNGMAISGSTLYWLDFASGDLDGRLLASPLATPAAFAVLATALYAPTGVATDGVDLVWTEMGPPSAKAGSVKKMPIQGGAITAIASAQNSPAGLAIDASSVYWTNTGSFSGGVYQGDGAVLKAPR